MEGLGNNPLGGKDFVETLIPQRFPFVMVDTLYSYSETALVSGFTIQGDAIFFEKDNFIESGIIEHMAQSVALHTGYQFYLRNEQAPTGYIGSIKDIVINKLPKLDDEIKTTVSILQEFGGITLVDVVTKLNDVEIAKGQMKTVLAK
jgi:predicted hotdog family 3-hydroxylacyl-ACP dehydratase